MTRTAGETAIEYVLPIVGMRVAEMVRVSDLDPVAGLLEFVAEWTSATVEESTAFIMHAFVNNARIVERHKQMALIERAQRKGARPVQGGRAPGTRKARKKRKRKRGR